MTPTPGSPSSSVSGVASSPGFDSPNGLVRGNPPLGTTSNEGDFVKDSLLYKEFVAERDEILRHKWLESEKAGHDIGFEKALLDWVLRYRSAWRLQRAGGGGLAGVR